MATSPTCQRSSSDIRLRASARPYWLSCATVALFSPAARTVVSMSASAKSEAMSVEDLPAFKRLSPVGNGRWSDALLPLLRDTPGPVAGEGFGLDLLDWLVSLTREELGLHPLPRYTLLEPPAEAAQADLALHFTSAVVTHRAERLLQLTELSGTALSNLALGSLQVAAIASRSLLEIAAATNKVHADLFDAWIDARSSAEAMTAVATNRDGEPWRALHRSRFGTRIDTWLESGYPAATNAKTSIDRVGKRDPGVLRLYEQLCEATHPNVEANAVFWRQGNERRFGELPYVEFTPTRSQSPVKTAVVAATKFSTWVLLNFCRDAWWIACDLVTSGIARADSAAAVDLGLPVVAARNAECVCRSGVKTKHCSHPPTKHVLEEWAERVS